jgi:hypothetical protein
MNRAVIVLLLLIANAILTASKTTAPSHSAAPLPPQNSLGLFRTLDGTAPGRPRCDTPGLRTSLLREDLPCVGRGLNL